MTKKIIIGLGNPGPEYEHTYHNVGSLMLAEIADVLGMDGAASKWKTHKNLFAYKTAGEVVLVRSLVFMNESGAAAREALKKFGGTVADLVVVHDESDLAIGAYKLSSDRNAAGHKGVRSIINTLGSKAFLRVRIGIRPPKETRRKKASAFVLKTISKKDGAAFASVFTKILDDLGLVEALPKTVLSQLAREEASS